MRASAGVPREDRMIGRLVGVTLALAVGVAGPCNAQDYPNRPIRVVVGPGPDIVARVFGARMGELLGQPIVVEPRPGAGGVIAAQTVAAAPPDGYTLLQVTASYTINTALQSSPLDLRKDFAPVGQVSSIPFVLVVHPSVPAKTLAELIAYAKANPGKLDYASSGIGTPPHLAGELFKWMAGVDIVHVPFREANSGLNAVVGGSVQMMFSIASTAQSQIAGCTVRGIGVTSLEPSPLVPGLPALAQSGLPGFEVIGWNGFVAPKDTPQPVIAKLSAAIGTALADADVRSRMNAAGYELAARNGPGDFAKFIAADTAKWLGLAAKTNMETNMNAN
jgi:tripartite-type tricarboxylate transporter receptor subunit TctC